MRVPIVRYPDKHSRRSNGSVALLPGCVPYLRLYRLPIDLDAASGELHAYCALALEVEFVPRKAREQVTLSNARISNQHHCKRTAHTIPKISELALQVQSKLSSINKHLVI